MDGDKRSSGVCNKIWRKINGDNRMKVEKLQYKYQCFVPLTKVRWKYEYLLLHFLRLQFKYTRAPLQFPHKEHTGVDDIIFYMLCWSHSYSHEPGVYEKYVHSSPFNTIQPFDKLKWMGANPSYPGLGITWQHDLSMSGWVTVSWGQWWTALELHRGIFWLSSYSFCVQQALQLSVLTHP